MDNKNSGNVGKDIYDISSIKNGWVQEDGKLYYYVNGLLQIDRWVQDGENYYLWDGLTQIVHWWDSPTQRWYCYYWDSTRWVSL